MGKTEAATDAEVHEFAVLMGMWLAADTPDKKTETQDDGQD